MQVPSFDFPLPLLNRKHQDPFYQLGKLYVYKLQIELFQYSSEHIDTGIKEVDVFETLKTFETNTTRNPYGEVTQVNMTNHGSGYTEPPIVSFVSSSGSGATAEAIMDNDKVGSVIILKPGTGYKTPPIVTFTGDGVYAAAETVIEANIDKTETFADNNKFKTQAADILFSVSNPFGDIDVK